MGTLLATQLSYIAGLKHYTIYCSLGMQDSYTGPVSTLADGRMLTRTQNLKNPREAWSADTSKILTALGIQTATATLLLFYTLLASQNLDYTAAKIFLATVCSAHVAVGKHKIF